MPRGECRKGAGGCRDSERSDTPLFPGSDLLGVQTAVGEEGWGKPELARGKPPDKKSRGPAEGDPRGIGKGCACSYLLRCVLAGGDGVPRRSGEALSARFRIPPASGLDCRKRHGFPLGPKDHSANRGSPALSQRVLTGSTGAALRTDGGGRTH